MAFDLITPDGRRPVVIPTLGRLAVHNALAGAAVGIAAGLALDTIVAALAGGWSAPHRGQLIRAGDITIVDDSYNASPGSVIAALELLGGMPGRRIAVLGEMLELGDEQEAGHERVGREAAGVVDRLVVVGSGAAGIAKGARAVGLAANQIAEVGDRAAARERLLADLRPGDVVLVKASRGIALDVLVDELVATLGSRADESPKP
jgi:UDP-N-acetylmuramoyl-tripeptide--D-alanyl-D-alanine ligase